MVMSYLGRVVCSTGDDDFAGSSCRSSDTSITTVLRTGLVEILTIEELDTSGARRGRLVESDLGNMAVGSDIWIWELGLMKTSQTGKRTHQEGKPSRHWRS